MKGSKILALLELVSEERLLRTLCLPNDCVCHDSTQLFESFVESSRKRAHLGSGSASSVSFASTTFVLIVDAPLSRTTTGAACISHVLVIVAHRVAAKF